MRDQQFGQDDAPTIILGIAAGEADALTKYYERYYRRLVHRLEPYARQYRIDKADMDAEQAVDSAFVELRDTRERDQLRAVKNGEDLGRLIITIARVVLLREKRRSSAAKRRGGGSADGQKDGDGAATRNRGKAEPLVRRYDVDLDLLESAAPSAEEITIANDELEAITRRWGKPIFQKILAMRMEGFTEREIAARNGVSKCTVRRRLGLIRNRLGEPRRRRKDQR
jgi:DNA-directed RNA polymerase specialized sigma24 family protein